MSEALRRIPLACPIDGLALRAEERRFVCERGHAYDLSRHGHVNLLPVQFKPSRDPGDDAAMVASRRRVLDGGLFDPLADLLAEHVHALAGEDEGGRAAALLVDAGCGEGFYTHRLAGRVPPGVAVLGVDISRHAVSAAARRHRARVGWAVANNKRLPVLAGRADIVTSLFGFETWSPWAALQEPGQRVVVVDAGPRHLIELREIAYERVRLHAAPSDEAASRAGYRLEDERSLAYVRAGLDAATLADVLAMTPHAHRARAGARETIASRAATDLTVDVTVRTYRRQARVR